MAGRSWLTGRHKDGGIVSGDVPIVDLRGSAMSALVQAIPAVATRTGRGATVIGGLAVVFRLSHPYRATEDLDVVSCRRVDQPPQLELLLASGAEARGVSGALVPTPVGPVKVDVLEVTDAELAHLPTDPTDRLHVLSHSWAAATASPMIIRTEHGSGLTVAVAEPGPLVAMKLQSIMNRGSAKEATDLLDIINIVLDPAIGPICRAQLASADGQLRKDAAQHAELWFGERADRSFRLVQASPIGSDVEVDDLRAVGELLSASW